MARVLGLDWGEKRVGVAIADERVRVAVGYDIWPSRELLPRLQKTCRDEEISRIVVGYPLTLRGEAGAKARQVDHVIALLEKEGYPVCRWDERYTTHEARREFAQLGISEKKQRGRLDMAAAVLMLQSYLDARDSPHEVEGGG